MPARGPVLLACDLDGTLLDHEGIPVPGAAESVGDLVTAGALFVVVTGRPLVAARRATAALGVEPAIYVCYHGALIVDGSGSMLRHQPISRPEAAKVVAGALTRGVAVTVWDVDEPRELEPDAPLVPAARTLVGDAVSRLVLRGEPPIVARLLAELRQQWAGRLRIDAVRPGFAGVLARVVDKGEALGYVAGLLGIPLGRTVACGDGAPDETLLRAAAVPIAVGQHPHALGHLPGVTVASWARLPSVLRARVLPLL